MQTPANDTALLTHAILSYGNHTAMEYIHIVTARGNDNTMGTGFAEFLCKHVYMKHVQYSKHIYMAGPVDRMLIHSCVKDKG